MARQVLGGEEPQSGSHQVVAGVHLPVLLKGRSLTRHEVDFLHTVELVSIQPLQTDGAASYEQLHKRLELVP